MRIFFSALASVALLSTAPLVSALNNGLGIAPQMAWNSWNKFGCDVSDKLIRETADALNSTGLAKLGYNYVNIDDCWQTARDSNGVIIADPVRFPNGIPALAEYVHSLGLKFGLYSDAGQFTCQGRPGGYGHEITDANTYAAWKVDYLKYDNCYDLKIKPEIRYPPMRDALNATGRPIFFSMCEWGVDEPYEWAPSIGNSWRTTGDINDSWGSMIGNIHQNDIGYKVAGPGQWNDPDMLEVGNGGMTDVEYQAHFSLWALAKAPLIIGCDVRNMSAATMAIISNKEVIALNQDALGVQGHMVSNTTNDGTVELWAAPMASGATAALVLNTGSADFNYTLNFSDVGANECNDPRDLWAMKDIGESHKAISVVVPTHGVRLILLTPCQKQALKATRKHHHHVRKLKE